MAFAAMALEQRLYGVIKAAVTSGVEIYHVMPPENASAPYVVVQRISTVFDHTLQAQSQFVVALMQIDVWHDTDVRASNEAGKIRRALAGLREGAIVNRISGAICDSELITVDPESKLYRRSLTFRVMMREDPAD